MPRSPRIVEPGFPHHVMHRGNNRRRLFSYPRDFRQMLRYIADAVERVEYAVQVHAFVLMVNHLHLVATPRSKVALSKFVQSFAQRYSEFRNRKRNGSGKLYEERFIAKPILEDDYLAVCHGYLELNPVRAGVVPHAGDYRWSSYCYWAGDEVSEPLIADLLRPSPFHLGLGTSGAERGERFARWVEACRIFSAKPDDVEKWDEVEAYSNAYTRRLERPDGSSAKERRTIYFTTRPKRPTLSRG